MNAHRLADGHAADSGFLLCCRICLLLSFFLLCYLVYLSHCLISSMRDVRKHDSEDQEGCGESEEPSGQTDDPSGLVFGFVKKNNEQRSESGNCTRQWSVLWLGVYRLVVYICQKFLDRLTTIFFRFPRYALSLFRVWMFHVANGAMASDS